jgi:predicted MFS family arabinose efflux permease
MIPSVIISSLLGKYLRHKTIIVAGLLLFIAGGAGAGTAHSFPQILFFRAMLGFGTGLFLPFSTGLIAACYNGRDRSRMMGLSFASGCLGAVVGNISAGILASYGWKQMFHVYWIGVPVLILVLFFLKNLPENGRAGEKESAALPLSVFKFSFFAMFIMMTFFLIVTNLSSLITSCSLGSSEITGIMLAANAIVMLAAGIMFPFLSKKGKHFTTTASCLIGFGLLGISIAQSTLFLGMSLLVCGFGIGSLFPYILVRTSSGISANASIKAMSVCMAFSWFGQFLSPLFFGKAASLLALSTGDMFLLVSVLFLLTGVLSMAINRKDSLLND